MHAVHEVIQHVDCGGFIVGFTPSVRESSLAADSADNHSANEPYQPETSAIFGRLSLFADSANAERCALVEAGRQIDNWPGGVL
jgi:hypothetical protein